MMVRWNCLYVIVLAMLTYSSLAAQQTEPPAGSLERSAGSFVALLDKKEYVKATNAFDAALQEKRLWFRPFCLEHERAMPWKRAWLNVVGLGGAPHAGPQKWLADPQDGAGEVWGEDYAEGVAGESVSCSLKMHH
jgi:hypothetical protein